MKNVIDKINEQWSDWVKVGDSNHGILQRLDYAYGVEYKISDVNDLIDIPSIISIDKNAKGLLNIVANADLQNKLRERCVRLKAAYLAYLIGDHDRFEQIIKEYMHEYKDDFRALIIKDNQSYYRMRVKKEGESPFKKREDLFHSPLNLRKIAKTYRYSLPGFPCLYLGGSLYVCWEEMRRPDLNTVFYSAFRATDEIKVLDLRRRIQVAGIADEEKYILTLPLIIACSMQVKAEDGKHKVEYAISQQVLRYVMESMDGYAGIAYSSAMQDLQFEFVNDSDDIATNLVLYPRVETSNLTDKEYKYAGNLKDMLRMTEPTCYTYEYIKDSAAFYAHASSAKGYKSSFLYHLEDKICKKFFESI